MAIPRGNHPEGGRKDPEKHLILLTVCYNDASLVQRDIIIPLLSAFTSFEKEFLSGFEIICENNFTFVMRESFFA